MHHQKKRALNQLFDCAVDNWGFEDGTFGGWYQQGAVDIVTVATLTSFGQGAVPITEYSKVLVVALTSGVNAHAPALNVPPLPVS